MHNSTMCIAVEWCWRCIALHIGPRVDRYIVCLVLAISQSRRLYVCTAAVPPPPPPFNFLSAGIRLIMSR